MSENPNRIVRVSKVVVNIGVGEAGERLLKAQRVLNMLTGQKAVRTLATKTNRDLGIRDGMAIGCKVTLRKAAAKDFLVRALAVRNNRLPSFSFDPDGNFSFGIPDYTDFEGMKYDPEIGLYGMDVSVALERPGYRVGRRRAMRSRVGHGHRITKAEGIEYARSALGVEVFDQ